MARNSKRWASSTALLALMALGPGCCGAAPAPPERAAPRPTLSPGAKSVGILVFDQLFITEFVAPFDVYKHAGEKLNVFTVAARPGPVRTYEGVRFEPDYTLADAPRIDVLVVPSGLNSTSRDLEDRALVDFVRSRAESAELVTSHCWGAFTLANAGLLDGKDCTTFPTSLEELSTKFPALKVKTGPRFVVAGKFVTSNGGLAAFEAALYVVERLLGREEADRIAAGLVFAPENVAAARQGS